MHDYVVQTVNPSAGTMMLAKAHLEAKGFTVYLPLVVEEIRTGRQREKRLTVLSPLFPGYVFVRLDLRAADWRQIGAVRGVKRLLGRDGEHPTPLPDNALDELRARFDAGEFVRKVSVHRVNAGDQVSVTAGAFEGHTGVCTLSRGERVKVLLSRLWGSLEVEMPADMVRAAG